MRSIPPLDIISSEDEFPLHLVFILLIPVYINTDIFPAALGFTLASILTCEAAQFNHRLLLFDRRAALGRFGGFGFSSFNITSTVF